MEVDILVIAEGIEEVDEGKRKMYRSMIRKFNLY
jgi:hypothetical protein